MPNKEQPALINLVRIKDWFVPADAASFKLLSGFGVKTTKISSNLLPTLQLLLGPAKIEMRIQSFVDEILNPFLDHLGGTWKKLGEADAVLTRKVLTFNTHSKSVNDRAMRSLPKLEERLGEFFDRWGYSWEPHFSEHRGKIRYQVKYQVSTRLPVIPSSELHESRLKPVYLTLGNTRISMELDKKFLTVKIQSRAGDEWKTLHNSKCLHSEVEGHYDTLATLINVKSEGLKFQNDFVLQEQHKALARKAEDARLREVLDALNGTAIADFAGDTPVSNQTYVDYIKQWLETGSAPKAARKPKLNEQQ